MRVDVIELIKEAANLGMRPVISTNGTLIDRKTAEILAEAKVSYVGISIDGPEEFHDEFRGVPESFIKTQKGIENCRNAGIRTGLRFTITTENSRFIPFAFEFAAENNIRRICFYHLIRTGRAEQMSDQVPGPQQTRAAIDRIIDYTERFVAENKVDEVLTVGNHADGPYLLLKMEQTAAEGFEQARELLRINGGNKIGEKLVCIGPDGNVYPDQFWRNYPLGNVKDQSFERIWHQENEVLRKLRNKSEFAAERCKKCKWFEFCKGNYRFTGRESDERFWHNEPACYLTDAQIGQTQIAAQKEDL